MNIPRVIESITEWLTAYCGNAGMAGFAVGVSGGIDSAVTSTLCARTGKKVFALSMPIYQTGEQVSLSTRHIRWLESQFSSVKGVTVDLTSAFRSLEKTLPTSLQDDLTMANSRSRLRMITLYAFAGHHRMLVAGTGNRVEDFGVGFYTKYGDGGVDISPIADLVKSEVYAVGRELGISEDILKAPPTDGLWADDRTDESQIGATYGELEWAMAYESTADREATLSDRQKQVLDIYRRLHNDNRHKMEPIPVFRVPDSLR